VGKRRQKKFNFSEEVELLPDAWMKNESANNSFHPRPAAFICGSNPP
jgi:hypothetical protein